MAQHEASTGSNADVTERRQLALTGQQARARQVRLRTIIWIRWVAIAGQLSTLLIVQFGLGWSLPIDAALGAVVASVLINVVMMFRRPSQGRIGELEAAAYLGFDILQLAVLLYLTGGLENPFALLFLGPVTVSATILSRSATAVLSALVVVTATFLAFEHFPLPWAEPGLQLPVLYISGLWVAVVVGTLFMTGYIGSVAGEGRRMSDALTATQLALAREQQLSAVGGLAAAAAHELGSPLATIAVTVKELSREMPPDNPFMGDIEILQIEADRCRDILAEIGRAPELADPDDPFATGLLSDVVAAAATRYRSEALALDVVAAAEDESEEPVVPRSPEFLHGLGNVIQNAVQFGQSVVSVEVSWDETEARVEVRDDGRGFPPGVLDRVGEPYISNRGDGHLGLGIFIAQTLLERTGARIRFSNIRAAGRVTGAEVMIVWQRDALEVPRGKG
ncbi:MAG: ActS/PrrB/RegB family redox-sensitive histidine kinase [Alphaproteobacteria bacterium]|jgi:two-component system, sensor histidine kinase RegB|nr:ActS/PrrB/RegB family redox-sensitive histidine kinase [Alphaproteobacteria bacterium]